MPFECRLLRLPTATKPILTTDRLREQSKRRIYAHKARSDRCNNQGLGNQDTDSTHSNSSGPDIAVSVLSMAAGCSDMSNHLAVH
jgi:hypothetical protein